ncbi:hypothetical protein F5Y04DRAFT_285380 [Hypomontagnella monticulosa]|nr:hypothetical protein F5Y04DRAFT_285380 [Hypomontagnella monticulosa]
MSALAKTIAVSLLIGGAFATNHIEARDPECPGVRFQNGASGCCVGGTIDPPVLSVCEGWPICQGPTTTTWSQTPISCATIVTDGPSYSALVSSAESSMKASGTHFATRLDGNAIETSNADPAPGQTGSSSGPSSTSSPSSPSSSSTPTGEGQPPAGATETPQNAAAEVIARMGLAGGAALAAAAAAVL